MKTKINFHNMDHSENLESHTLKKLQKLEEFCTDAALPLYAEVWLKAENTRPHHKADVNVKVNKLDLHTSSESRDLYVAIDEAIDKMVTVLKKTKAIEQDKHRSTESDKRNFSR